MDNVGMYTTVCVYIYEEKKNLHVCISFLNTHTHTHNEFTVIRSDHTVQEAGCMASHHNRPVCLWLYRYLSLQPVKVFRLPCGIVVFAPFAVSVCQCWALHSPMDQCSCIDPLEQPLVPLTFQVHPRQLLPVAPLVWRWLTSVRSSQARNQSANWCQRVGCCWSVSRSFFG